MNGWMITTILFVLICFINLIIMLAMRWDIKTMTRQLKGINKSFGTNELLRTNTHQKSLRQFTAEINQLIHLFKQNEQYLEKREGHLKKEIANISHDIRTPLTSMKGFSELLVNRDLSEKERKRYLTIIQTKMDYLIMMPDQFYGLSQLDALDSGINMEKLQLDQIVVEQMLMFYNDFEKRSLQVYVSENHVPCIVANREALNRIISNIVQNALRCARSYFHITMEEKGAYIQLSVKNDVGNNIDLECGNIFNRTFQGDPSRNDGHLGLGLNIVSRLVQQVGGTVEANVENNTFIISVFLRKWEYG